MTLSCPFAITRSILKETTVIFAYSQSFIDQAWLFKMAWTLASLFFFSLLVDLDSVSVHKRENNNLVNIQ